MDWDAIGAVGDLVSGVGVVVTLAYLARQVHVANRAAADANRLERARGAREMMLALATDAELRAVVTKRDRAQNGLTPDEDFQLGMVDNYWFWLHWGQWASSKTPADLEELRNVIRRFYSWPGMRQSWERSRPGSLLDPAFVRFVDECLASAPRPE